MTTETPTDRDLVYPPLSWHPTPQQMPLWWDLIGGIQNILVIAHRQFGKDELFLKSCCLEAMKHAGNYVYCLPETEHLRRVLWRAENSITDLSRIDEAFPEGVRSKKLNDEMVVEIPVLNEQGHPTGAKSVVQFVGSDNHKALRGMIARAYYFSEWAFCDPMSLAVIRPVIERNEGLLRFFTTTNGKNHAYRMLLDNRDKRSWSCHLITNNTVHPLVHDPQGVGIHHMQSHQVPHQRMNDILEENISLYGPEIGQAMTEQEYECSFEEIVPGSLYLDLLLKAEREGRIRDLAPRRDLPVHAFFDLGFTDPTSIWYVQIKEDGWIDCIDYDEFTITSAPEVIPELKGKSWFYSALYLPHDGAHHEFTSGTTVQKLFEAAGFVVHKMEQTDDAQQIPSVRTILPRCRFANTEPVKRGLECLRHYHNKPKNDGARISWSPRPVHDWSSHAAKAFSVLGYYAPDLKGGVQPPKRIVKDFFRRQEYSAEGAGWMR